MLMGVEFFHVFRIDKAHVDEAHERMEGGRIDWVQVGGGEPQDDLSR